VTSPNASDTMPIIANWIGWIPAPLASGWRIAPTMMIAGIASRNMPTTRNTNAMKNPVASCPMPQADTPDSIDCGIW